MPATSKDTRLDFSSRAAKTAAAGAAFVAELAALASDYGDVFAAELTDADYAGSALDGFQSADVATVVGGYAQIGALLNANDGAIRKAVARLAQFNR